MMAPWAGQYVGIPFVEHGRTVKGCDCYGLFRLALAEKLGKVLPEWSDGYDDFSDRGNLARLIDEGLALIQAVQVEKPDIGDLVQVRYFGDGQHIGMYVGDRMMLHSSRLQGYSCIESLAAPMIRSRIVGYFRIP
jgi:probable lipoprotein NlpC